MEVRSSFVSLYFYSSELTPITTPGFWIFYLDDLVGVRGENGV